MCNEHQKEQIHADWVKSLYTKYQDAKAPDIYKQNLTAAEAATREARLKGGEKALKDAKKAEDAARKAKLKADRKAKYDDAWQQHARRRMVIQEALILLKDMF